MLLVSILVYFFFSVVCTRIVFNKITFTKTVITFYLVTFSFNILICELLSFLSLLNNRFLFLFFQLVLCVIVARVLWKKNPLALHEIIKNYRFAAIKPNLLDSILFGLLGLVLTTLLVIGISTVPNNLDSLHTHLTRIYYWLQHGSLANWNATGVAQLIYPINSHLQGLWLFLLGGNENLFFLVSWYSLIVICCAVYEIARLIKFSHNQALLSVMVLLAFPVMLLQTYSFQNDLAVTALITVFLWLIFSYRVTKATAELVLAILALSLSLGVKQTAFFVLPAIVVFLISMLYKKQIEKKPVLLLGLFLSLFLLFSSFKYVHNIIDFHSFFGVENLVSEQQLSVSSAINKVAVNASRFLYDAIDPSGLGYRFTPFLTAAKANVFRVMTSRLGLDLEGQDFLAPGHENSERFSYTFIRPLTEDTAWFGPLLFTLVPLSLLVVLLQNNLERKKYLLVVLMINISYFALVLIQRPGWDPYQGRYFILSIAPLVPLTGALFPNKKIPKLVSSIVVGLVFSYLALNVILLNGSKPIITSFTIVNLQNRAILPISEEEKVPLILKNFLMKRTNQMINDLVNRRSFYSYNDDYYEQLFYASNRTIKHINMVNSVLKVGEQLYLYVDRDPLEYSLFGVNRTRILIPVMSLEDVASGAKVLVEGSSPAKITGFTLLIFDDRYAVYQKE